MLDYVKGFEMLPHGMRGVGKPAMGEGVSGEEVAELVMNSGLGYAGVYCQEGAGGKGQKPDQQKSLPRTSEKRPQPTGKGPRPGFNFGFLPQSNDQE